jgi:hypothetical protein
VRRRKPRKYHPPRWGLFGLAFVGVGMAIAFAPTAAATHAALPTGIKYLTLFIPLWVYALAWLASGILVAIAAIRRRPGWEGVGAIAFMSSLFGSFYVLGWFVDQFALDHSSRSYVVGVILIGLALYISGNVPPDPASEQGLPSPPVDKSEQ